MFGIGLAPKMDGTLDLEVCPLLGILNAWTSCSLAAACGVYMAPNSSRGLSEGADRGAEACSVTLVGVLKMARNGRTDLGAVQGLILNHQRYVL